MCTSSPQTSYPTLVGLIGVSVIHISISIVAQAESQIHSEAQGHSETQGQSEAQSHLKPKAEESKSKPVRAMKAHMIADRAMLKGKARNDC